MILSAIKGYVLTNMDYDTNQLMIEGTKLHVNKKRSRT